MLDELAQLWRKVQLSVILYFVYVLVLVFVFVLVPQDTEQLDQLLHGSDAGRAGALEKTQNDQGRCRCQDVFVFGYVFFLVGNGVVRLFLSKSLS